MYLALLKGQVVQQLSSTLPPARGFIVCLIPRSTCLQYFQVSSPGQPIQQVLKLLTPMRALTSPPALTCGQRRPFRARTWYVHAGSKAAGAV